MYPPSSVTEGSYTCLSGDALSCQQSSSLGHYIDAQQCGASADNSSISFLNVGCYMFHNSRPLLFLLEGSLSATQVSGLPRTRSRRYLHPLCASLYLHDRSRFSHVCQPLTTHAICIAADSTGEIQLSTLFCELRPRSLQKLERSAPCMGGFQVHCRLRSNLVAFRRAYRLPIQSPNDTQKIWKSRMVTHVSTPWSIRYRQVNELHSSAKYLSETHATGSGIIQIETGQPWCLNVCLPMLLMGDRRSL